MSDLKTLNKRSDALATRAKNLANDLHIHMVAIVSHVKQHGDCTAATYLVNKTPTAVRRQAMVDWFTAFGGMNFSKDKEGNPRFTRNKNVPADEIDLELAEAESPWEYSKEKELKVFDLQKAIAALVKRAEKKAEEAETLGAPHKIDAALLAQLEALA